jgi:hypothetical protein
MQMLMSSSVIPVAPADDLQSLVKSVFLATHPQLRLKLRYLQTRDFSVRPLTARIATCPTFYLL